MIDFKTYEEQLDILVERGLIIEDRESAKKFLMINNYYNVINAYKPLFIHKGVTPEKFIKGTTFEEIQALHKFDKDLRIIFSNILIKIERTIKSIVSHEFTKTHPNHDLDYLNIDCYNTQIILTKEEQPVILASELVTNLSNELNSAIEHNDEMVCHYKNKYNNVPLWVFINKLSFGTISKMYKVLNFADQVAITESIGKISNISLNQKELGNSIKILVYLRNKTAHDQIIYNFSSAPTTVSNYNKFLLKYKLKNVQSLFGAIGCLNIFLEPREFDNFIGQVKQIINELFLKIHSIPTAEILNQMGIPKAFLD